MWFAGTLPVLPATIGGVNFVETSKDHPKENKQRLYIQRLLHSKAVSLHHLPLVESQRQAGERESYFTVKEKEGFRYTDWGCWHRDPGGRLAGNGECCVIGLGGYLASLVNPELEAGAKKSGSHWPSTDRVELIATDVAVWLPGLVAAEVGGQGLLRRSGHYPLVCSVSALCHWHWA